MTANVDHAPEFIAMKLTRKEAALSLDLPLSTLDRWVRQGRIPYPPQRPRIRVPGNSAEKMGRPPQPAF